MQDCVYLEWFPVSINKISVCGWNDAFHLYIIGFWRAYSWHFIDEKWHRMGRFKNHPYSYLYLWFECIYGQPPSQSLQKVILKKNLEKGPNWHEWPRKLPPPQNFQLPPPHSQIQTLSMSGTDSENKTKLSVKTN